MSIPAIIRSGSSLFLRTTGERLPLRVYERIQRQQEASEILIGRIQLLVVAAFAVLYALSPKTFGDEADFAPVPWALGVYFLFTVLRLVLAHRRTLPGWMLYVSIVLDMLLLLGLIWSFHIQYQQPAAFYLKAPTLLYLFIFIALRALRFEVRYVLAAGLMAAAGWLGMVVYAIAVDPWREMVTRDYVEYLTSNTVLLGGEFDKIISILLVTGILSLAIARARRLLIQSVVEESAHQDLSRFVPTEIAAQITAADEVVEAWQGEVREATILFTDIERFTAISESVAPEELIKALNEYFQIVAEPLKQYGGVISQFQGDAVLATFNVPTAHPKHAANAIRAALLIQERLAGKTFGDGLELKTRIGINTGVVVGGLVGTGDRLGYTVHGDNVNLAARLEALNKEYKTQILVSESTRESAGADTFKYRQIGEVQVRGRHVPTVIYTVERSFSD